MVEKDKFSANTALLQVNVTGWKEVYNSNGVQISTNGKEAQVHVNIQNVSVQNTKQTLRTIPSTYIPLYSEMKVDAHPNDVNTHLNLEGTVISTYYNSGTAKTMNIIATFSAYPLETPLY